MNRTKSILVILLILCTSAIFAFDAVEVEFPKMGKVNTFTITEDVSLLAVADSINMPIKKLKFLLAEELEAYGEINEEFKGYKTQNRVWDNIPLHELNIDPQTVADKFEIFTDETLDFGYSITLVGILVVFFSLLLISILIAQFQHIDKIEEGKKKKVEKRSTVQTSVGKITANETDISSNAIVAVIAALHRHKMIVEERRKTQLTFSRTPVNMWRASGKMEMPNSNHSKLSERI